jgi:hypothetical protein
MKKLLLLILLLPTFAFARPQTATIKNISNDAIIILESGKLELAGIIIPPPVMSYAVALLNKHVGEEVELQFGKLEKNRYGNYLAQTPLQNELLAAGLAVVYTSADNNLNADAMLTTEQKARDAKLGIWQNPDYQIVASDNAGDVARNKFCIIEGVVTAVKKTKEMTYINFGEDWKNDFTVGISKENTRAFGDVQNLVGKKVRVRGWMGKYNGPFVEVYSKENLESGI